MKIVKKLLRVCTLVLTLTLFFAIPVFADLDGSGLGSDMGTGGKDKKDGFLNSKSGYIVYTSGENGVATSNIVAFCWSGGNAYSTTGAPVKFNLATRFSQEATFYTNIKAPWGYAPCGDSSGMGLAIKNWLMTPRTDEFAYNADYVMAEILGFSKDQIQSWYDDPNNKLNVEPFLFGGYYSGSSASSFTGVVICGSTTAWASIVDADGFGGTYTNRNLPNSMFHDITMYPSFPAPTETSGKHSSATILANAYGIVTVSPKGEKQMVKVYKTNGAVDNTTYGFTANPADIKDEGSYKVKKWNTSKTKTKATSNKADYPEVIAGCDLVKSGSGAATVELTAEESAIFVLLEREAEIADVVLDQDSIRAHELKQDNQGAVSEVIETPRYYSI